MVKKVVWSLQDQNSRGFYGEVALRRLIAIRKGRFTWREPRCNPYLPQNEQSRCLIESRYRDIAFALSNT
ncbi:hypothetical protein B2M26_00515 [Ferroacidibacillus organovorans]|uniref:Uncharacterized protein n=1 Tax=Ferroacidibacillus organovorans TaxID=1765683 RepID=A0A1V4EXS6_9BACL|nr:hypothetical protein B2M26_00515 [Ferroacidibacillus organovorans]